MKKVVLLFLFLNHTLCFAQNLVISGRVLDIETGEKLIGVSCFDTLSQKFTLSSKEGFYSFFGEGNSVTILFSYVGYKSILKTFTQSGVFDISMESGLNLEEVVVTPVLNSNMEYSKIDGNQILRTPGLLGESDVLKSLQFIPGIQSGTEGSSSIFVRGGGADQNLVLWDDALIYNLNHLGGFFSVFNPHLVKKVQVYKSHFPANYGGRGSSVIQVSTKEGNLKKYKGTVDLGVINQNVTFEGPIIKNKSSFIISARNSNLGLFTSLRNTFSRFSQEENRITFNDVSARLNTYLGSKGQLVYSFFSGSDTYTNVTLYSNRTITNSLSWSNAVHSLKYLHNFNNGTLLNTSFSSTTYNSNIAFSENFLDQPFSSKEGLSNSINDLNFKLKLDRQISQRINIFTGLEVIRHKFQPSFQSSTAERIINEQLITYERAAYVNTKYQPTSNFSMDFGLRYSSLLSEGEVYDFWEPRVLISKEIGSKLNLQLNYNKMNQFMHSLSNTGTGFNVEVWVPANTNVAPLHVENMGLGYSYSLNKFLKWNQELYVKNFTNLIMYREGENLSIFQDQSWFEKINRGGQGRSYGLENSVELNLKNAYINTSYTWSRTEYRFVGVNSNNWFPFKYDRRHNLAILGLFDLNNNWKINAAFYLMTGQAFTSPVGVNLGNYFRPQFFYESINNARFPIYHRLDIGISKSKTTKRGNENQWSFGFYNLYNRKNPAYLDVTLEESTEGKTYQVVPRGIFPIIPFVKYQFKF